MGLTLICGKSYGRFLGAFSQKKAPPSFPGQRMKGVRDDISHKITGWAPGRPQKKVERFRYSDFQPKKTRPFCQPIFISLKPKPFKVFFCPQKCPLIISNKDVQGEISKDLV